MSFLVFFLLIPVYFSLSIVGGSNDLVTLVPSEHNGILKVDIALSNPLYNFHVNKVWACSSVDIEMNSYDEEKPGETGCKTKGFTWNQIYGTGTSKRADGSFHAELRYKSLFLHESLVDKRTPVVYIQIKLRITDEVGDPIDSGDFVVITRYTNLNTGKEEEGGYDHDGNVVAVLDEKQQQHDNDSGHLKDQFEIPTSISSTVDFIDEADGLHWYYLTIVGAGLFVATLMIAYAIVKGKRRRKALSGRDRDAYIDWDAETGEPYGNGVDEVTKTRRRWSEFALRKGFWRGIK